MTKRDPEIDITRSWMEKHEHCGPHLACCEECCPGCEADDKVDGPHWYDLEKDDPRRKA